MTSTEETLSLPKQGNILSECVLELMGLALCERALGSRSTTFTRQADVLVVTNRILGQSTQDWLLIGWFADPVAHALEHFALNLRIRIMEVGMEEALQNILCDLMDVHRSIVPSLDDKLDRVGNYNPGQLTGWFIQNQVKVVLAQERMGRVRGTRIVEDFILIVAINDLRGSGR
jgi:hypothetical protein